MVTDQLYNLLLIRLYQVHLTTNIFEHKFSDVRYLL